MDVDVEVANAAEGTGVVEESALKRRLSSSGSGVEAGEESDVPVGENSDSTSLEEAEAETVIAKGTP